MWWDWTTSITLTDSLLFTTVSIIILYVVGFGIFELLSSHGKINLFKKFDWLQKFTFRVLFGFIFLIFFITIFSMFNLPFLLSSLIILGLTVVGVMVSRRRLDFRFPRTDLKTIAAILTVIIVASVVVFFSSSLVAGYYGSTNDDGADHTLSVRLILENPYVIISRSQEPYATTFFSYPSGSHVVSGFLLTILNVQIQKIVILTGAILPILIALGFYSTLRCLFGNRSLSIIGLVLSGVFSVGYLWLPMSWGGLPLLMSLFLSVCAIGLIHTFLMKDNLNWLSSLVLGLLFFAALQTYPVALLFMFLWFILVLSARFLFQVHNSRNVKSYFNWRTLVLVISFLIPILISLPYIYSIQNRFFSGSVFSAINQTYDPFARTLKPLIAFDWLFDLGSLSAFFSMFGQLFIIVPFSLAILVILLVPRISRWFLINVDRWFRQSLLLVYSFMILIFTYLTITIYLPINFLLAFLNSERVVQHLVIPAVILTSVVLFSIGLLIYKGISRWFLNRNTHATYLRTRRTVGVVLLTILLLSVGWLSIPVFTQQQSSYRYAQSELVVYETLAPSDLELMQWIHQNVPADGRILVSMGDSGQYLSAVTQRISVYRYNVVGNYTRLISLLAANASDPAIVPLLKSNNVSYVYIGSIGVNYAQNVAYYLHFNASQFQHSPYFDLERQVGDAWLFKFTANDN